MECYMGGTDRDFAYTVALDSAGNVYIGGHTWSYGPIWPLYNARENLYIAKYNSNGVFQWNTIWGTSSGFEGCYDIVIDSLGNIFTAGGRYTTASYTDFLTVKFDSAGVKQWHRTWGYSGYDILKGIVLDSAENVIVGGAGNNGVGPSVAKYDTFGNLINSTSIGGTVINIYCIALDSQENIYLGGPSDFYLAKFNTTLHHQWSKTFSGGGSCYSMVFDKNDTLLLAGVIETDMAIGKIKTSGNLEWVKLWGEGTWEERTKAKGIALDSNSDIYLAGHSEIGDKKGYLVKFSKDIYPPDFSIISPVQDQLCGNSPIFYDLFINESNLDSIWYTINESSEYFATDLTGYINQTAWDTCDTGTVTIKFYANDTSGYWSTKNVTVLKDTHTPNITINTPYNETTYGIPPLINITALDPDLQYIWYKVNGQQEFLESGVAETLRVDIWNSLSEGIFTIELYANNSIGNLNNTFSLTLYKDTHTPRITINAPYNETTYAIPPLINITALDPDLQHIWYNVGGQQEFLESGVAETLRVDIWNSLSEGIFTIELYANNSIGNLNNTFSLTLYKDTLAPNISILSPINLMFCNSLPIINITATDINLEYIWYNVSGQQEFLESGVAETLRADIWSFLGEGIFMIELYANDSLGNLNNNFTIQLHKDTISPTITIISPSANEKIGQESPEFRVFIHDTNLDKMKYSLNDGLTNYSFSSNSSINQEAWQALWNSLSDGDSITITFYAEDKAGNIGSNYIIVTVDKPYTPPEEDNLTIIIILFSIIIVVVGVSTIFLLRMRSIRRKTI